MQIQRVLWSLYNLITILSIPVVIARLLWRSYRNIDYRKRMGERFGKIPISKSEVLWIHAVSVGEVIAVVPLIRELLHRYPNLPMVVTTTTPTGSKQLKNSLGTLVEHMYMPYDISFLVKRFLKRIKPHLIILIETEIWPNVVRIAHDYCIPVFVANARMSKQSARKYARFGFLTKSIFSTLYVAAQSRAHAKRFSALGVRHERMKIVGSIKYDVVIPQKTYELANTLRSFWPNRISLIAASTHEGEEKIILKIFQSLLIQLPTLLLFLVPRHPERCKALANLCEQSNLSYVYRTEIEKMNKNSQVLLGNTLGELIAFYASTDIAFVGGSLVPHGGHNVLEPALLAKPIVTGPHVFNFADIHRTLSKHQAIVTADVNQMESVLLHFITDANSRNIYGTRARDVVAKNQGALMRHVNIINDLLVERKAINSK